MFVAGDNGIGEGATLTELATAFASWLNADSHFAAFYQAAAQSAAVEITDTSGVAGTLAATAAGGVTIESVRQFASGGLGILTGRKYALAYQAGSYMSELSPLSPSTGPTGGAARIEIRDPPRSDDSRVTAICVYAAPDGQDGPLHLVATAANGDDGAVDSIPESALAEQPTYPGAQQPALDGGVRLTVKQDGSEWYQLDIPADRVRSEPVHGFALDPVDPDVEITVDVENNGGPIDLVLFLQ